MRKTLILILFLALSVLSCETQRKSTDIQSKQASYRAATEVMLDTIKSPIKQENNDTKDVFDHKFFKVLTPIILGILGSLVTLYLHRNEFKRKELELKRELVEEMSKSVMKMIVKTDGILGTSKIINNYLAMNTNQKGDLQKIYDKWKLECCVIGSKVHAYYREPEEIQKNFIRRPANLIVRKVKKLRIGKSAKRMEEDDDAMIKLNDPEIPLNKKWSYLDEKINEYIRTISGHIDEENRTKLSGEDKPDCQGEKRKFKQVDDNNFQKSREMILRYKYIVIKKVLDNDIVGF